MICYLVRHGQDDPTVRGGWSMASLTDEGQKQVANLAGYISANKDELRIERLFSSDLPRAVETATPISTALNIKIELTPQFRETNNGLLAGVPNDIASREYPGLFWSALDWDEPYPEGESPREFYQRVECAWESFSQQITQQNKNVMLVTHQGVISVLCSIVSGTTYSNKAKMKPIEHTAIIPLRYCGKWKT